MSRIKNSFLNKAKIAYLTASKDPLNTEHFLALVKGGANILEIGIPFSDPIADGPTIQEAMNHALREQHTTIPDVLKTVKTIRQQTEVAIIIFTYYNPIFNQEDDFFQQAKQAGADGILIVDLPYEESLKIRLLTKKYNLELITIIAPSTPEHRIKQLVAKSDGFIYYVSKCGTTGISTALANDLKEKINLIRKYSPLPIAVGFGISNKSMVDEVLYAANADGCVVGSYFVNAAKNTTTAKELEVVTNNIFL